LKNFLKLSYEEDEELHHNSLKEPLSMKRASELLWLLRK
jgi:hypothetical protein